MVKKQVLDQVAGFDETFLNLEDFELWLRVTRVAKIAYVPSCTVKRHLVTEWKSASLRNICDGLERILAKYRSELKPPTLARRVSRIAILLFNYEPRRARALAWEGLRLRPFQPSLLVALALSTLGRTGYRWVFRKLAIMRDGPHLGRVRIYSQSPGYWRGGRGRDCAHPPPRRWALRGHAECPRSFLCPSEAR